MTSVSRKLLMALSGLGFVVFVILHLAGNLFLYADTSEAFNRYAYRLHSLGSLVLVGELGLLVLILGHAAMGVMLKRDHSAARPVGYQKSLATKGGPSHSNVASRNMIVTGLILLGFLVFHVWQFRFGPSVAEGYTTTLPATDSMSEVQTRDLYRLVAETFMQPLNVVIYTLSMVLLGFHLKHGIWSALQSLGATNPTLNRLVPALAWVLAIVLAGGFLFIPIYLYGRFA